jgi:hypothetical protein
MNKLISLTVSVVILLAAYQNSAFAGTVSDTFSTGDTLTADHLNNIKDAVNDNDVRISNSRGLGIYIDAVRKGALIDALNDSFSPTDIFQATMVTVLLDSEYIAYVSASGDGLKEIELFYESVDCTGQAYDFGEPPNPILLNHGYVYSNSSPSPGTAYYVPAGSTKEVVTFQSQIKDNICQAFSSSTFGVKVYLNDASITGITNTDFVGEIKLGF